MMTMVALWHRRALRSPEILAKFIRSAALPLKEDDVLLCSYLSKGRVGCNWGDKLNPVLVSMISGKRALNVHELYNVYGMPIYVVIGSGLGYLTHFGSIVWGQGFAHYHDRIRVRPRKIYAVRGPLSRQKLLDSGLECPNVLGDPALLLPRYFDEDVTKRHRIGLIPHFSHLALPEFVRLRDQGAEIIDITGDLFDVVRSVKSCHMVASSSLHGLIMADAYGIPSKWLQVVGYPIEDGFKFHDYLRSIARSDLEPFVLNKSSVLSDIEGSLKGYEVEIDIERLYESCPFKPLDRRTGQAKSQRMDGSAGPLRPIQRTARSQAARAHA
jgi:pyruvyltransferase